MKKLLFQTGLILSAFESCARKQIQMASGSEKKKHFVGIKMLKKLSEHKTMLLRTSPKTRSSSDLQFQYFEAQKLVALAVKLCKEEVTLSIHRQKQNISTDYLPIT